MSRIVLRCGFRMTTTMSVLLDEGRRLRSMLPQLWIALELLQNGDDLDLAAIALTLSMRLDLPVVASNDVHMHVAQRKPLQDVLTAIRLKTSVQQLGTALTPIASVTCGSIARLRSLYPAEMLQESVTILERCRFSLDELRYEYPEELVPPHLTPSEYLAPAHVCRRRAALAGRCPRGRQELLETELELIETAALRVLFSDRARHRCVRARRRTFSVKDAARLPIPRSATASTSPKSIHRGCTCCSNASYRRSVMNRPTSMSTSNTNGARKSSSTSTSATDATARRSLPR